MNRAKRRTPRLLAAACAALVAGLVIAYRPIAFAAVSTLIAAKFPELKSLSVDELASLLASQDSVLLLDARTRAEYDVSHLHGAQHVDPKVFDAQALAEARDQRIVVYCSAGYRSALLAQSLQRAGLRNVENLDGGIFAWANAGHPMERNGKRVREVHPFDALWGSMLAGSIRAQASP